MLRFVVDRSLVRLLPGNHRWSSRTRGFGAIEAIVVLAIVSFLLLCVLIVLPRGRESSRMAGCQRNLMQIGVAVQLYDQGNRQYPHLPDFTQRPPGDSPIQAMLTALTLPDFLDLRDAAKPPKPAAVPGSGTRVAGLTCPSDPRASPGTSPTALSYRANVGDATSGLNGPFSPGVAVGSAAVDAADGLSFTAGFAERLVGTGRDDEPGPINYLLGPVAVANISRDLPQPTPRWRGDAGSSWGDPGWRSAAYSHAMPPNTPVSRIAEDGRTAEMTGSSAHPGRINVWMLDGSIRGVTPTISPAVWKTLGSYQTTPSSNEVPR